MSDPRLFDFLVPLAVREGATVIRPHPEAQGQFAEAMRRAIEVLRHAPAQVSSPSARDRYRFAERSAEGEWMLVWIPR